MRDFLLKVFVGRGNQSNVKSNRLVAADPFNRSVFKDAKKFSLQAQRNVSDFIEEKRAVVGSFKPANPLFVCACKSTFFVPEKLGFQSTFTENLTVYRDKMPSLSGTQIMDILCGNFFADAGFA